MKDAFMHVRWTRGKKTEGNYMKKEIISNWVTPAKVWIKVETLELGRI